MAVGQDATDLARRAGLDHDAGLAVVLVHPVAVERGELVGRDLGHGRRHGLDGGEQRRAWRVQPRGEPLDMGGRQRRMRCLAVGGVRKTAHSGQTSRAEPEEILPGGGQKEASRRGEQHAGGGRGGGGGGDGGGGGGGRGKGGVRDGFRWAESEVLPGGV